MSLRGKGAVQRASSQNRGQKVPVAETSVPLTGPSVASGALLGGGGPQKGFWKRGSRHEVSYINLVDVYFFFLFGGGELAGP